MDVSALTTPTPPLPPPRSASTFTVANLLNASEPEAGTQKRDYHRERDTKAMDGDDWEVMSNKIKMVCFPSTRKNILGGLGPVPLSNLRNS